MILSASSAAYTVSTARTTMLRNGLRHDLAEADLGRDLARERRELVVVQRVARERADEVVADARERRVQRVRALDVRSR